MIKKSRRPKTCPICKGKFTPTRPIQPTCAAFSCMIGYIDSLKAKKQRKEIKSGREKLKSKTDWLNDAQTVFNRWIRVRDIGLPCISCQRHHGGQYHAGHYRTTKAAPALRFNELNVNKQCAPCNNNLSGNVLEYRINLIKKIGIDKVEWLESEHPPAKFTIEDAKISINKYKQILRGQNGTQV